VNDYIDVSTCICEGLDIQDDATNLGFRLVYSFLTRTSA
jgi:hypothetical protein